MSREGAKSESTRLHSFSDRMKKFRKNVAWSGSCRILGHGAHLTIADVSESDKSTLNQLLSSAVQQVRVVLRALALRQLGEGRTVSEVAALVGFDGESDPGAGTALSEGRLERASDQVLATTTKKRWRAHGFTPIALLIGAVVASHRGFDRDDKVVSRTVAARAHRGSGRRHAGQPCRSCHSIRPERSDQSRFMRLAA